MQEDQHLRERTINDQMAYEGSFLHVKKAQVQLPSGKTAQREFILHPGASMVIPLFDDGTVLLERQYRYPLDQVFIEFPAGKIDAGESALTAAQRELMEETGYTAQQWQHVCTIHNAIAYSDEHIELYLARGLQQGTAQLDEGEFIECFRAPLTQLLEWIDQGKVTDVKTMIGAYAVDRLLRGAHTQLSAT